MAAFVEKIRRAIGFIGWNTALQALLYSFYRDLISLRAHPTGKVPRAPGKLQGFESGPGGGMFHFEDDIHLEVRFLAAEMLRTTWTPGRLPLPYALYDPAGSEETVGLKARETPGWIEISSETLTVRVNRDGSLHYLAQDGELLHFKHPPEQLGDSWQQCGGLFPEERVYGLGSRAAPLNLRPGSYRFWNTSPGGSYGPGEDPLYMGIPVSIHMHRNGSFLQFHENASDATIHLPPFQDGIDSAEIPIGAPSELPAARIHFSIGALRTYFISGPPEQLLERFSHLTGRPGLPPRWSLGFHHCRWGYETEEQVRGVLAGFVEYDLPLQAYHQDIDYMDGFRVFTIDEQRFPDMKQLVDDMHHRGIRWVPILDPGVKRDPGYAVYAKGKAGGLFVKRLGSTSPVHPVAWPGWCAMPDFTNPETREWWSGLYDQLFEIGADGIWHDLNEPEAFVAWGPATIPTNTRHDLEGQGGTHLEAHNLYGLLMDRAGYEALQSRRPQRRPWILTRSGWAGVQRYAWHWTADVESSWEALRMTVPQVLNIGLSGVPYSGSDIGGFSGNPDAELYTRWFQMSALMPFFRNHAAKGTRPREPWVYGEPYTSVIRGSLRLRQKLMPYLYTLAWESAQNGAPLVRPLFWMEPDNPDLWDVGDSFMLGNALLVAPVLETGARIRRLTLPSGRWTYFWMEYTLEDTHLWELPVTLQRIPIFVRGGTVLPLEEDGRLVLHVYPDTEGRAEGRLYSDAGDGHEPGRVDRFSLVPEENQYILTRKVEGDFPFPWKDIQVKLHNSELPVRLEKIN